MKLLKLYEVTISQQDLDKLGEELTAVLATTAYAVNEINLFLGLFLLSDPDFAQVEQIRKRAQIQKFSITRALNAKTFEAIKLIDQAQKILKRRLPNKSQALLEALLASESLKTGVGYEITKEVRNNVTNHYLPSKVKENLNRKPYYSSSAIVLHETEGGSYYPFAEDLVFAPLLQRFATQEGKKESEIVDEWMKWSYDASKAVRQSFFQLSEILLFDVLEKKATEVVRHVEPELFEDFRKYPLPLFHSRVME